MALFNVPGLSDFVAPRRNALLGLASGLARGTDLSQGLAYGFQGAAQGQQADDAWATSQKAEAERQRQIEEASALKAKYAEFFTKQGRSDIAQGIADGIVEPGAAYMDFIKPKGVDAPANIQEWNAYNSMTQEQKAEYLRMKRATPYLDVGTGYVSPDPLNPGQTAGAPIVKDNFTPAYDAAAGGAAAKVDVANEDAYESLKSKLPGLQTVIGELSGLANTATYTQTGQLIDNAMRETGMEPGEAAVARTKYIAMVDNQVLPLLRDTFGAAFTVKEGETLRATLGDPNKAPAEKQVILEAFIEQKVRDLEGLQSRLPGASAPAAGAAPTNYKTKYGLE